MSASLRELPAELPEGCTRRMDIHCNYGSAGGLAVYSIYLPTGEPLPIVYQYDTRKPEPAVEARGKRKAKPAFEPCPTGFVIDGEEGPDGDIVVHTSWRSLRDAWKAIRARASELAP